MELYFLRHSEWESLYNCSLINVDSKPLAIRSQHKVAAFITIGLCAIFYTLYVPCMHSLWKHMKDNNPCTRILFYMGCMDFGILWVLGFLHGSLSFQGAVFCTHPLLIYAVGVSNNFFFSCEMMANLLLAINRCMDLLVPSIATMLFGGRRVWLWLGMVTCYGLYWMIFVPPALFNGIYFAYFFNPYHGYIEDVENVYHPLIHTFHDWFTAFSLVIVYGLFMVGIKLKMRKTVAGLAISRLELMTFLQVFVISLVHVVSCVIYVLMQIGGQGLPLGDGWIVMGEFSWLFIHGLSPVIFLTLNRTIREDCIILIYRIFNPNRVRRIHGVTVVDPKVPHSMNA